MRLTLYECKVIYEWYFSKALPEDMPYRLAASMVLREIGPEQFEDKLTEMRKQ